MEQGNRPEESSRSDQGDPRPLTPELVDKPDSFELVVGPPKSGKSSLCKRLLLERLERGRWCFVQDSAREFEDVCVPYATAAAWTAAAAAATPERPLPRAAAVACFDGADELVELVFSLGDRWNRSFGACRAPICLALNESTELGETGSTYLGKLQSRLVSQRRHLGIEVLYCLQWSTQLPRQVYAVATRVYLFRQTRADSIADLELKLNLERGSLGLLATLPPHRFVTWEQGKGLV